MARILAAGTPCIVAAALVVACGGDDGGAPLADGGPADANAVDGGSNGGGGSTISTPAPATIEDFVAQATSALCEARAKCCTLSGETLEGCAGDVDQTYVSALKSAVAQGKLTYSPQAAATCIGKIKTGFPKCNYYAEWNPVWEACEPVLTGPPVAQCSYSFECQPPARDAGYRYDAEREHVCVSGVCSGRPPSAVGTTGSPCSQTCHKYLDIFWCNGTEASGTCWKEDGLVCSGGVCSAPKALDAPCKLTGPSEVDDCGDGLHCDDATDTCKPRRDVGADCTRNQVCVTTAYCGADKKCKQKKAVGQSCTSDTNPGDPSRECLDGTCVNGKCVALDDPSRVCGTKVTRVLNL